LKMEQMVALPSEKGQHLVVEKESRTWVTVERAYGIERRKTMRMPNCVFFDSCTLER
jgi:hypothetical protein